jgi:hypothetical protein
LQCPRRPLRQLRHTEPSHRSHNKLLLDIISQRPPRWILLCHDKLLRVAITTSDSRQQWPVTQSHHRLFNHPTIARCNLHLRLYDVSCLPSTSLRPVFQRSVFCEHNSHHHKASFYDITTRAASSGGLNWRTDRSQHLQRDYFLGGIFRDSCCILLLFTCFIIPIHDFLDWGSSSAALGKGGLSY